MGVSVILFADKYWLVATSANMLGEMTSAWLALLGEYGWEPPTLELTWCSKQADGYHASIKVNGDTTRRASGKEGFKALGTMVTLDDNFDVEIEDRITWGEPRLPCKLGYAWMRQYTLGKECTYSNL